MSPQVAKDTPQSHEFAPFGTRETTSQKAKLRRAQNQTCLTAGQSRCLIAVLKRLRQLSKLSSKISEKPGAPTPGFFFFSAYLSPQIGGLIDPRRDRPWFPRRIRR